MMLNLRWNYSSLPRDSEINSESSADYNKSPTSEKRQLGHKLAPTNSHRYLALAMIFNTILMICLIFLLVQRRERQITEYSVIGLFIPNDNYQSVWHEIDHFWDDFSADTSGFVEIPHKPYKYGGIAM